MIACSAQQVGKTYGGNIVFENLSFEILERDRVGLTGRNGSGKTTLFKLLAGAEVPDTASRILDLEDGEITLYQTNYSGFVKEKEERLLREFQQYEEQQKKIKKMKEAIKRLREWANQCTPPNAGLHKRASSMEKALQRMEKLDRPVLNRKKMNMDLESSERSGKDVVLMKEVSKSFGSKHLFQNASMHIQFRDRTSIVGDNGTGKSTLIKMILGELEPDAGEIRKGSNLKIGYLSQHVFSNADDQSVIDTFREGLTVTEGEARHILAGFLFYGYTVFRKVSQLSGGERMRLRLAQLMHRDINFLILDEPTNHLDIESREVLEEALEEFNGTILAVSHDRYFINRIFSKICWIDQKELHYYEGDYDWARKKMEEKRKEEIVVPAVKKAKIAAVSPKKNNKGLAPEELEYAIEQLETSLIKLEMVLEKEMDFEKLQIAYQEKEELEKQREELYGKLDAIL